MTDHLATYHRRVALCVLYNEFLEEGNDKGRARVMAELIRMHRCELAGEEVGGLPLAHFAPDPRAGDDR